MRSILILMTGALISGCSTLTPALEKGADAYDQLRLASETTLCRVLSVGAVLRAYPAGTPEGEGWWGMCKKHYAGSAPPWRPDAK